MIVVISPFPTNNNKKDGMIQRVEYIDNMMLEFKRVYLEISFTRFWHYRKSHSNNVEILCLNFFRHFFKIRSLLKKAKIVYAHSAHGAIKIFPFSFAGLFIFDAHGVVPEEMQAEGRAITSIFMRFAEKYALRNCHILICVTNRLANHLKKKYKNNKCKTIILPILPINLDCKDRLNYSSTINACSVIYAGGVQSWQNVDMMAYAASIRPEFEYTFLTPEFSEMTKHLEKYGVKKYSCLSVSPDEVKKYYRMHTFGFILRDASLINLVACPTKLIEYMYWGVVPIVIKGEIGDFHPDSLKFISLDDFSKNIIPNNIMIEKIRMQNHQTVINMVSDAKESMDYLSSIFKEVHAN